MTTKIKGKRSLFMVDFLQFMQWQEQWFEISSSGCCKVSKYSVKGTSLCVTWSVIIIALNANVENMFVRMIT